MTDTSVPRAPRPAGACPPAPVRPRGFVPRAARLGGRAAQLVGFRRNSPDPRRILAAVAGLPGSHALAEWQVEEPLARWAEAMHSQAGLSGFGRIAAHYDAVRLLQTLCRLGAEEERAPAVRDEPIRAPLFILGMPRSGTTFLHGLLAQDPANRVPLCWNGAAPYPPERGPDRRRERIAAQVAFFNRLAPELASLHPLSVDIPQECGELTAPTFRSLRFDTTHRVPGHRRWVEAHGHDLAYRFHRRFLQHLQHQDGAGQWVLKCPDHIFALPAIERVYPDARFLFVHRDPLKVLPSVARLTEVLREPFADRLDPVDIGTSVAGDWHDGARLMVEAGARLGGAPGRVLHLHFGDLRDRPLATVERLYDHFGMAFTDAARTGIAAEIARRPRGGYGRNRYRFEDFGLVPAAERARFRAYTDAFAVPMEVDA